MQAAQGTYDAYELLAETFEKIYPFFRRLNDSLMANVMTTTMMESYALVAIDVLKIVILATKYAGF